MFQRGLYSGVTEVFALTLQQLQTTNTTRVRDTLQSQPLLTVCLWPGKAALQARQALVDSGWPAAASSKPRGSSSPGGPEVLGLACVSALRLYEGLCHDWHQCLLPPPSCLCKEGGWHSCAGLCCSNIRPMNKLLWTELHDSYKKMSWYTKKRWQKCRRVLTMVKATASLIMTFK